MIRSWKRLEAFGKGYLGPIYFWITTAVAVANIAVSISILAEWGLGLFLVWFVFSNAILGLAVIAIAVVRSVVRSALGGVARVAGPGAAVAAGLILSQVIDVDLDGMESSVDIDSADLEMGETSTSDVSAEVYPQDLPPLEEVSGYTKSDGTQVDDYVRTKADGIEENNLRYRA